MINIFVKNLLLKKNTVWLMIGDETMTQNLPFGSSFSSDFVAEKGYTCEMNWIVRNSDRKPVNLIGKTVVLEIVHQDTGEKVIESSVSVLPQVGRLKFELVPHLFETLPIGYYRYIISLLDGVKRKPMYVDQGQKIVGGLYIQNSVMNKNLPFSMKEFFHSNTWGSSTPYMVSQSWPTNTKISKEYEIVIKYKNFIGLIEIQASVSENPNHDSDWVTVNSENYTSAQNSYTIEQVNGNFLWLRTKITSTSGFIEEVIYA